MHELPHRAEDGRFRNPWPGEEPHGFADYLKVVVDRRRRQIAPDPPAGAFPLAQPTFLPRANARELIATWVGHSTVLLQIGNVNVLTDPVWSERASPVDFAGPRRFAEPGIHFDALPPVDVVLLSHNHYDHFDKATIRALARRSAGSRWLVPLGLGETVARLGARRVNELDWWADVTIGDVRFACTPARHFSARGLGDRNRTLWCSWAAIGPRHRVFFAGDTAYHPDFVAIAERYGPFDLALLPIGAYEPRWFMGPVHMNPEDVLCAYRDLATPSPAARPPALLGIHWGTFRLTDEEMTEPPNRMRGLWQQAALPPDRLWVLQHGETRRASD